MNNLKKIKLILLDVDGTLTDGKIYYDNNGNEMKSFDAKDGMAIAQAVKTGIEVGIITGRKSTIVDKRANELGIKYVYQGISNKVEVLKKISRISGIHLNEIMYIGDDINDLEIMNKILISACPNDAANEVLEYVDIISNKKAGNGAVREIIELVLKEQNKWLDIVNNYKGIAQ